MKPTTQKFLAELNKKRPSKISLASNDDASQINDQLDSFRAQLSGIFQEQNTVFDEQERVNQMWRDLASKGESLLSEYYGVVSTAETFITGIEATANELGISADDIHYIQELKNNLSDTMNNEDGLVDGVRFWQDNSRE